MVELNPVKGSEQKAVCPVVIISGDAMNDHLNICIVCPLSTRVKNYAGCVILEKNKTNNLDKDSEVITFQVRAVSKERLVKRIGEISKEQVNSIRTGLSEILTY